METNYERRKMMTRLCDYTQLRAGMRTAEPVFREGKLLIRTNTELSNEMIMRLPLWHVFSVFVYKEVENEGAAA